MAVVRSLSLSVLLTLAACASAPPAKDVPAVITSPTAESRAELLRLVTKTLHGASVTLGDDALTHESTLIVERARPHGPDGSPLQGRDRERPAQFRLVRNGKSCILVHEGSGRRLALTSTGCAAR